MKQIIFLIPLLFIPATSAAGCTQDDPCAIPMATDSQDGLYFGIPGDEMYNVTAGDWFQFEVTNWHDGDANMEISGLGLSMSVPGTDSTDWDADRTFGPYLLDSPGDYQITDDKAANSITLRILVNDVTDVEAGDDPITDLPEEDPEKDVPGFGILAMLAAVALALLVRRQ